MSKQDRTEHKLTKPQRIALEAIRDHDVTYGSAWDSSGSRVFVDGEFLPGTFPIRYRTLVALQERGLVELTGGMGTGDARITDAGRAALEVSR